MVAPWKQGAPKGSQTACSIQGCDKPPRSGSADYCEGHYHRMRRSGNAGDAAIKAIRAGCAVEGCPNKHFGLGYCERHYARVKDHGTPDFIPQSERRLPRGEDHYRWSGPDVGYSGAHQRVTKIRGKASAHTCAMGCGQLAAQWSIVRSDGSPTPHSPDPADYQPLCVGCHKRYDMAALINEGWPHRVG